MEKISLLKILQQTEKVFREKPDPDLCNNGSICNYFHATYPHSIAKDLEIYLFGERSNYYLFPAIYPTTQQVLYRGGHPKSEKMERADFLTSKIKELRKVIKRETMTKREVIKLTKEVLSGQSDYTGITIYRNEGERKYNFSPVTSCIDENFQGCDFVRVVRHSCDSCTLAEAREYLNF